VNLLSPCEYLVKLLEELIGSIWGAMDHGVVIIKVNCHGLPFEKLLKVFPVVHFLLQLKAVVVLVHLNILRVVPLGALNFHVLTLRVFQHRASHCSGPSWGC
jgi:hypothetical protein